MRSIKNKKTAAGVHSTAELAKRLNLSRWTISRVLNGHDGVHPKTVARIQAAMSRYGFSPNALAQGLKTGCTNIIGICLPEIEGLYLGQKLEFLREALAAKGFHVMMGMTNGNAQEELATLSRFRELRVAGVILVASQIPPANAAIQQFLKSRTPLIQIDPMMEPPAGSICVDRGKGMKEAVRHLFDLGHRHIATLGFSRGCWYSQQRLQAILATYQEQGIKPQKYLHLIGLPWEEGSFYQRGRDIAATVWAHPCGTRRNAQSPTAVLALNDRLALGFIDGLRALGARVPEDVSVIGYDNMEVGAFVSPRLATIDARPDELIRTATERLLQRIHGNEPADEIFVSIPARLLRRESTGLRPKNQRSSF
ncbi:MAG: LacI family DNA-binding transcriptional regulator [Verrucomicrobiota bacterium]